jgi:uncharacterized protein YtpQ (UPF0354 family)
MPDIVRPMASDWRSLLTAPDLGRADLREAYRRAMEETGAVSSVTPSATDQLQLDVRARNGGTFIIDLHNLWESAVGARPDERIRQLLEKVAGSVDVARGLDGDLPPVSRTDLVPTIKSAAWLAGLPPGADLASEPLVADLVIVYAFDRPSSISYASRSQIEQLQIAAAELRPLAVANLSTHLPAQLGTQGDGRSSILLAGGSYESSVLLLDGVWEQLAASVAGDIVACVPARDICLFTGTGVEGGVASLIAARDRVLAAGTPGSLVSPTLLRRHDVRWVELERSPH